ncbi:hypothetical protein JTP77_041260, partial [Streptomyces sp. S9]|nr:hypothetical protein [Streptomyces sp. S9]
FSLAVPGFHEEVSKMIADTPASAWQAYLRFHTIDGASPFLSDAFVQENFNFYSKTMRGQKEIKDRWKRVLATVEGQAGEAMGQLYVKVAFSAESKQRMQALVENLRTVAEVAHRKPVVDERRHQEESAGEVGQLHPEDRLPGQVARLERPEDRPRQLLRQRQGRQRVQLQVEPEQDRQAGRQDRMGHEPADG